MNFHNQLLVKRAINPSLSSRAALTSLAVLLTVNDDDDVEDDNEDIGNNSTKNSS